MTICITGHDGYIGSVLVTALLARGHRVRGIDSFLFGRCALPDATGAGERQGPTEVLDADIRDLRSVDLAGADAVVHLAGLSNDPLGDLDPALTRAINCDAAVAVAVAAKAAGVARFVFASTCSVYGAAGTDVVDEQSRINPLTPYAVSKAEAERAILALADAQFAPIAMRFATAYGFSPKLRFDLVANNLVAHALATGRVFLKSTGNAWRPLIHVADIAEAIAQALAAPVSRIAGAVVNVGADTANHRVRMIAESVAHVVPGARIVVADGAEPDRRSYRVAFVRLGRVLPDFVPRWSLQEGVADLHARLSGLGLTIEVCEGERYGRLAHLRAEMAAGRLDPALRPIRVGASRSRPVVAADVSVP